MAHLQGPKMENTQKIKLVTSPIDARYMEPNSLYLDGAVLGTIINTERNSFSFDHHGEGTRFDKTSTAFQVVMAANQGLDFSSLENIYVSSVDCDSVLATMVALNPSYSNDLTFVRFLQDISRVDNGGFPSLLPGEVAYLCFFSLRADVRKEEEETSKLLVEKVLAAQEMYLEGSLYDKGAVVKEPGTALVLADNGEVMQSETCLEEGVSFEEVYSEGTWGVLLGEEKEDGSRKVTIGKKPFAKVKSLKGLWAYLNKIEDGWGGADSIGGSPFQVGTKLSEPALLGHIQAWLLE